MSIVLTRCGSHDDLSRRDDDVRAVYSWAISHLALRDAPLLVSPDILHISPDDRCLEIPRVDLDQMHAGLERSKNTSWTFPESLRTSSRYIVLDSTTAAALLASPLLSDSELARRRFPRATHIMLFSDVSSNARRTKAAVHVDEWCGGMCGRSYWITLQKDRNVWTQRPWVRCVEIP